MVAETDMTSKYLWKQRLVWRKKVMEAQRLIWCKNSYGSRDWYDVNIVMEEETNM